MSTEAIDTRFEALDSWDNKAKVFAIIENQQAALNAVSMVHAEIARAVDMAKQRLFGTNGRLVYVGAGTSGRVAVQDGVELYPTFGWGWDRLLLCMAGGDEALIKAVENAEDDYEGGRAIIAQNQICDKDVIIGVAASGRTPFTHGAIEEANNRGALTIGFANNAHTLILEAANIGILLDTGPEIIAGSTRLKAGTAQKIALNAFSSALMIDMGGLYKGYMVGMIPTNQKLRNRAIRIIMGVTGTSEEKAIKAIKHTNGNIKSAILYIYGYDNDAERNDLLLKNHANLSEII